MIDNLVEIVGAVGPIFIIGIIFYFLVIRPQQKKMSNHQKMIQNLRRGDQVITAGGLLAKIIQLDSTSNTILVQIAKDVNVRIRKHTISEIIHTKE